MSGAVRRTAPADPWNHNIHYHRLILDAVPPGARRALDVGCGEGTLARQLRAVVLNGPLPRGQVTAAAGLAGCLLVRGPRSHPAPAARFLEPAYRSKSWAALAARSESRIEIQDRY